MLPLVKEAGKFVQTDEIWTTNPHSHLSCILFFHTTARHTKLALVKAFIPLQVSRLILVWSLWLQKYPSNELVSFSRLFFSQWLGTMNVTILASAVLPIPILELLVTAAPNVTLWMAQPSLLCMRTAQNSKLLLYSQGWCFVEDKGNKCVMCVCEKSWFVNQEYYDRWFSLYYKLRNVG